MTVKVSLEKHLQAEIAKLKEENNSLHDTLNSHYKHYQDLTRQNRELTDRLRVAEEINAAFVRMTKMIPTDPRM